VRFPKKCAGFRYSELLFLHPLGSAGHVVHSGASGASRHYFSCRYGFDKKCIGTNYAKLVFLHSVGSTRHVVHSGASGA
jgi:hypothetical protein